MTQSISAQAALRRLVAVAAVGLTAAVGLVTTPARADVATPLQSEQIELRAGPSASWLPRVSFTAVLPGEGLQPVLDLTEQTDVLGITALIGVQRWLLNSDAGGIRVVGAVGPSYFALEPAAFGLRAVFAANTVLRIAGATLSIGPRVTTAAFIDETAYGKINTSLVGHLGYQHASGFGALVGAEFGADLTDSVGALTSGFSLGIVVPLGFGQPDAVATGPAQSNAASSKP